MKIERYKKGHKHIYLWQIFHCETIGKDFACVKCGIQEDLAHGWQNGFDIPREEYLKNRWCEKFGYLKDYKKTIFTSLKEEIK